MDFDGYLNEVHAGPARVLPAREESYGFFGTASRDFGQRNVEAEWGKMFRHVASRRDALRARLKRDLTPGAVRDFLDSKNGRHLADRYASKGVDGDPVKAWSSFGGDEILVNFMKTYDPKDFVGEGYSVRVGRGVQGSAREVEWMGEVPAMDDFGDPISDEFVDGRTSRGAWAVMTPASFRRHGVGEVGHGAGQRYRRQGDGRWLKVEGAVVNESAAPEWKNYAASSEIVVGKLKFVYKREPKLLHLTFGTPSARGTRYFYWAKRVHTIADAGRIVASTLALGEDFDPAENGYEEHMHRSVLVARWQSRGGKYSVELYHNGSFDYSYTGSGVGGGMEADSAEEAISRMERMSVTDQPSANRHSPITKMPRVV